MHDKTPIQMDMLLSCLTNCIVFK